MKKIFRYFGLVPGRLPPNSIALIFTYICYLRSVGVRFTLALFRSLFTLKILKEGPKKDDFKGLLYFVCNGLKVVNLPNKVPNWAERFLIFEGRLGGLRTHPKLQEESVFQKMKALFEVEDQIKEMLKDRKADLEHYVALWPQVSSIKRKDTEFLRSPCPDRFL